MTADFALVPPYAALETGPTLSTLVTSDAES
jgi:hypothetical protein